MAGKYRLTTLGCKVNQYESEQVRGLLEALGYTQAANGEHADLAIVNTCAVTANAAAKSKQALRRAGRHGSATFAVGCGVSADPATLAGIDGVAGVAGHDSDILAELRKWVTAQEPPSLPTETTTPYSMSATDAQVNPETRILGNTGGGIRGFAHRMRAFLKVQDGCDAGCTYCIVPKLRTRLTFKPIRSAVEEAGRLVAAGHREIVVTGIYLGAYGRSTAVRKRFAEGASPLADLIDNLARVAGLDRLRISSLEPGDADDGLLDVITHHENCVPHFHLPLQSGSDDILRRMNRQYTADQFIATVDRLRARFDRPAFTTDVIVGFPGETDADFHKTLGLARAAGFCKIHAFPFSPRAGTAAARWSEHFVHNQTVKDRMDRLIALERELSLSFGSLFLGQDVRVLVEAQPDASGTVHGRADRYFEVFFASRACVPGDLVTVRISRVDGRGVEGVLS